jgi:hypothetical protein
MSIESTKKVIHMFSRTNPLRLLSIVLCSAALLYAETPEFCALTTTVIYSDGDPAVDVPIKLVGPSGEIAFRGSSDGDGRLRICDFGPGVHTLVVGDPDRDCHATSMLI